MRAALGKRYGVCRGCRTTTWYFTYRPFTREGLAVELTRNRVSAVYTVWQPPGWSAPKGLTIGAVEAQVTTLAGPLVVLTCSGYEAFDEGHDRGADGVLHRRREALGLRPAARAHEPVPVIDLDDVQAAARRLDGVAHRTPVFTSRTLDGLVGASAHLKAECFQRGGAFKFRGAYNKIASLPEHAAARAACSPTRPATTRRRSRSPRACSARTRRSSCRRTRRPRKPTRRAGTAPTS